MAFGLQNSVVHKTPTGRIDSAHPDGADGSDLKPVWDLSAFPSLQGLLVGTPFALDLAAFLTDPGSPTSSLGFFPISGSGAVADGFFFSGTVLSNNDTLAGIGSFRLVAIRNDVSVLSPIVSYAINAPIGVDNVAPTVPTGITAAPGAANATIAVAFDPPCDIAPGITPASGTTRVDCYVSGVLAAPPSPIATVANALTAPTNVNIGPITSPGTPAFSQTGKVWTMAAAGTGIAATASEQVLLADFGSFASARTFIAKLNPYTSSAGTALSGLIIHETAAAGGKFLAIGLRPSNGTTGLYIISRTTSSGASSQVATQLKDGNGSAIVGPVYVKFDRGVDLKTVAVSYSLDQRGWTLITTQINAMVSAVHYALFMTSQSAGTEATASIEEVAISNSGRLTCTVSSAVAVPIQLRAVDVSGNQSALSTAITGIPKIITSTGRFKFKGGHGIYLDQNTNFDSQFSRMQFLFTRVPHVNKFQVLWQWANLENPNVPGDYSGNWAAPGQAGFQLLKRFADAAAAVGKGIHMNIFTYGGAGASGSVNPANFLSGVLPTYLSGSAYGPNTAASNGIWGGLWMNSYASGLSVRSFVRFWVPAVQARLFALIQAYGAQFDPHPGIEMMSFLSESVLPQGGTITYTIAADQAFSLGPNGYFAFARRCWPTTRLRWWANYLDVDATLSQFTNEAFKYNWTVGGPDTLNSPEEGSDNGVTRTIPADYVWQGRNSSGVNQNKVNPAYTNYVGQGNFGADVEPLDLDGTHSDVSCAHKVRHANNNGASDMWWFDMRFNSNGSTPSQNRTDTPSPNLLDFIESCAQGGNVNVNGMVAGIALNNQNLYPPSFPQ